MTLASEPTRTPPGRAGVGRPNTGNRSVSDRLPPTLLRLPDLDPEEPVADADRADDALGNRPPSDRATAEPTANQTPTHAESPDHIGSGSRVATSSATAATHRTVPAHVGSLRFENDAPESTPAGTTASHTDRSNQPTADQPITSVGSDPSESSWLSHVASRKALLLLLILIAGFAIFMPRSDSPEGEQIAASATGTDQEEAEVNRIAAKNMAAKTMAPKNLDIEITLPPESMSQDDNRIAESSPSYLQTAESKRAAESKRTATRFDPLANSVDESGVASGAVATTRRETATPTAASMIQQPAGGSTEGTFPDFSTEMALASAAFGNSQPSFEQPTRAMTSTPEFDPASLDGITAQLAAEANEAIRQMDAARSPSPSGSASEFGSSVVGLDGPTEPISLDYEPAFVTSRTPNPVTNWTDYLPPIDSDALASSNVNDLTSTADPRPTTATATMGEPVRTTNLPDAPDFRYSLPGETVSGATVGGDASSPGSQSPRLGRPQPEARVAMPGGPATDGMKR